MASFAFDRKVFTDAAKALPTFPGAAPYVRSFLERLHRRFEVMPHRFPRCLVALMHEVEKNLPEPIALVTCPACQGSATQRWGCYRHWCNRCGGWRKVPKTEETQREASWIWSGQPSAA
jgi:hypothetical protein